MKFLLSLFLSFSSLAQAQDADPYLWLEEIESKQAIEWVKARNAATFAEFDKDPRMKRFEKAAKKILEAKDKIPMGSLANGEIDDFWQDGKHVRGLWRRTTLEEYRKESPRWRTILDVDKLSKQERENWVYHGGQCLAPADMHCIVELSRGGTDAAVMREFNVKTKAFVKDGFNLPEAKSQISWLDADTVLVATDFKTHPDYDTLTESGYPRIVKLWKRGQPLKQAVTLFEADFEDVSAFASVSIRPEGNHTIIGRYVSFYETEHWLYHDGKLTKIPLPLDVQLAGIFKDRILFAIRSDYTDNGQTAVAGSLIALPLEPLYKEEHAPMTVLWTPDDKSSIKDISITRNYVLLSTLKNVMSQLVGLSLNNEGDWVSKLLPFEQGTSLDVRSSEAFSDDILVAAENFLYPTRLYYHSQRSAAPELLKSLPARFDARGLKVTQYEAISKDGTRIPYFLVYKESMADDGTNPVLLYGYGGFEISMTPKYTALTGKLWLEQGGAFALANIRGGGEFGPKWHQAALKDKRQNAFDDFAAVAQDLIARNITSPRHLGIMGGSNGGLLMGASFTRHPGLFNAVVCQVPLLDMLRYHKLLAGASWMGEYGDPDDPGSRPAITAYSPYQNLVKDKTYPKVLFVTSTKDDRVHPGHARKMAAKMLEMGHPFYYFENIEGGHGADANLKQKARRAALEYVYLLRQLR